MWLETAAVARAMREWLWLYPAVEIVHILGFSLLVGAAVLFDLRLLGVSRRIPVTALAHHLLPWARRALLLVMPSGLLMFAAHATEWAANPVLWLKLALLATAALNAWLFHAGVYRSVSGWNLEAPAAWPARVAAMVSLLCWAGVLACGRLLAYV